MAVVFFVKKKNEAIKRQIAKIFDLYAKLKYL